MTNEEVKSPNRARQGGFDSHACEPNTILTKHVKPTYVASNGICWHHFETLLPLLSKRP